MQCPFCKSQDTAVIDSREAENGDAIRRRRVCESCERRFTTYERVEGVDLKVIKKDGQRENFDRDKIKRGLIKATWKRPVTMFQIELLIEDVESKLRQRNVVEIKSWEIGNLVLNRLKRLDAMSYLLFASVYRDFADLQDFEAEIEKLKKQNTEEECHGNC
jgi:transcriptional repressor NrdR